MFLEQNGCKVKDNITKKSNLLIIKEKSGKKYEFAVANKIPIIIFAG
jgi:NAD-dependent DNA ligase